MSTVRIITNHLSCRYHFEVHKKPICSYGGSPNDILFGFYSDLNTLLSLVFHALLPYCCFFRRLYKVRCMSPAKPSNSRSVCLSSRFHQNQKYVHFFLSVYIFHKFRSQCKFGSVRILLIYFMILLCS